MTTERYDMPKMNRIKFDARLQSHLHYLRKMCPESKGFHLGDDKSMGGGDDITLEIKPYFIANFYPQEGYFILSSGDKRVQIQLLDFFSHIMECEKCLNLELK